MAVFKCKMCGAPLQIQEGATIVKCNYCRAQQTLPRLDDDRRANLYDRANHFRRNNEFDKAMGIYEQILAEDKTDAEAYWSIILCRFGIEYVEDPATKERIPTVNRAQFTSIYDDDNYKSALEYADPYQKTIYEAEAKAINEIQKGILAISQKEEPFDVFICYKETDQNGRRTPDSVLAQELYYELKKEGFKVFFSRITLEDKLGSAYEPYIFAALNSSKVMVVVGTRAEYLNAVWVKNEWSRYLALIKNGAQKTLIPAYRDMDPYDLPEEFSHLQAQDMSKLGFMQDLTRGIKKIVKTDAPKQTVVKETVVATAAAPNVAPLLKRAFMFLEDGEFDRADEFCEQVLNQDPENAQAYLGKLMVDLKVKKQEALSNCASPFENNKNYQKVMRFGDTVLKETVAGYNKDVCLAVGKAKMSLNTIENFEEAIRIFKSLSGWKNADELINICKIGIEELIQKEEELRKREEAFRQEQELRKREEAFRLEQERKEREIKEAEEREKERVAREKRLEFERQEAKKREKERVAREKRLEFERQKAKKRAKLYTMIGVIATSIVCAVITIIIILNMVIIPNGKYNEAIALMNAGKYEEAIDAFIELDGHKDSKNKINECTTAIFDIKYNDAIALMDEGNIVKAYEYLITIASYKDSAEKIQTIQSDAKLQAKKLAEEGKYQDAATLSKAVGLTEDGIKYERILQGNYNFLFDYFGFTSAVIPDGVTSIGERSFYNCSSLTSITIPNSVTSIGDYAFRNCSSLTSITIPDSVTSIGDWAFDGCSSLTSITIPNSVTSIGNCAFEDCSSLESITLPFVGATKDGISNTHFGYIFGASSSYYSSNYVPASLKTVVITGGTSIDNYAFRGCSSLTSITIPDSVTSIGDYAFYGCYKLVEVYDLSASITVTKGSSNHGYLGYYALAVYTSKDAASKLWTDSNGYIFYEDGDSCYLIGYTGTETELTLPESCNGKDYAINKYAFYHCDTLTSITIPDSVTSIGDYAFDSCSSLTSITIPDSVTSIGDRAFYFCEALTSITIPNSVTSIGSYAFFGCSSLTIYCEATSKPSGWYSDWNYSNRPVVWGYQGK